jgi:hypothetical protein
MRLIYLSILLVFGLNANGDEYSNEEYGIHVNTSEAWHVVNAAKLRIELASLTTEQMAELFRAYQTSGVVGFSRSADARLSEITLKMDMMKEVQNTAIDMAKKFATNPPPGRIVIVEPKELRIGDLVFGYTVLRQEPVGETKAVVFHHLVLPRSRSYVRFDWILETPDTKIEQQTSALLELVSGIRINRDADAQ